MTNKEIYEQIKDNFAGVKIISATEIKLFSKDGKEFVANQNSFDSEYDIRFHCDGGDDCNSCSEHGSEKWEILERK